MLVPGGSNPPGGRRKESDDSELARKPIVGVPCSSPRNPGQAREDVAKVVLAWAKLPASIRAAILALVDAGKGDDGT